MFAKSFFVDVLEPNFEGLCKQFGSRCDATERGCGNRILKVFANSLDPDETPQNVARSHFHLNKLEPQSLPPRHDGGPYMSSVLLKFCYHYSLDYYSNQSMSPRHWILNYNNYTHFHMDRKQISRCPVSG
ncbi:hypothetical protein DPMN_019601 [Dreissena polymorpha]|uniref:Uncharacterized protein n=1 Tax=Dreissena polymorpha TaxID=45954 RepID=A0A9D4NLC9_DREPO|nr:hypothetical protein DPMN_019601 [Dreissena polymorpha]